MPATNMVSKPVFARVLNTRQSTVEPRETGAKRPIGIARLVAVALLHRLMRAGGGARGHGRPAEGPVLQDHVHLHRRVAPAVEDLAGENVDDLGHGEGPGLRRNLRRRLSPFEGGTQTVWGDIQPDSVPIGIALQILGDA